MYFDVIFVDLNRVRIEFVAFYCKDIPRDTSF